MTSKRRTKPEKVALVTGGTAGFGLALIRALADWQVVTDGRSASRSAGLPHGTRFIQGDVGDPAHQTELAKAVAELGRLDLLVHNASTLGPLPMATLADLSAEDLTDIWRTNALAAHQLNQLLLPTLKISGGVLISLSSDAAVEHYPTWGGYGATKAALDHLTLTAGVEHQITAYAVDPGDMRTEMHQAAFPGEDISDRPLPEAAIPRLLALLAARPASGRYRLADRLAEFG